jgi:hypothetical protein
MSATQSQWNGKRTLRKPYATSWIYVYARSAPQGQSAAVMASLLSYYACHALDARYVADAEFDAAPREGGDDHSIFIAPGV